MSSLRRIKRRIRSVQNIHEITRAMEMIAGVRYLRVEHRLRNALPYFVSLEGLVRRLIDEEVLSRHALFEKREIRRELVIAVTGDRGLCGSFNSNLLRAVMDYLKGNPGREFEIFSIGRVGTNFFRRRGLMIYDTLLDIGYRFPYGMFEPVHRRLRSEFLSGRFDSIRIFSMRLVKIGFPKAYEEPYLGLRYLAGNASPSDSASDVIFEPHRFRVFETLLNRWMGHRLFLVLLHSVAAEYSARMVAMKLATDNGGELLKELTLQRNKIRQAVITKEMCEIMGGVNVIADL